MTGRKRSRRIGGLETIGESSRRGVFKGGGGAKGNQEKKGKAEGKQSRGGRGQKKSTIEKFDLWAKEEVFLHDQNRSSIREWAQFK